MNKHYVPVPSDHYDQMDSTTSLRFNMEKEPIAKGEDLHQEPVFLYNNKIVN
jgi:hypothetical protein